MRYRQQGFGILSILATFIVLILIVSAMRVIPAIGEYLAIRKIVNRVSDESLVSQMLDSEIIRMFDTNAAINRIDVLSGTDLYLTRTPGKRRVNISFEYNKHVYFIAERVYLGIYFTGESRTAE